jgi:chain length determinant protein EpsF
VAATLFLLTIATSLAMSLAQPRQYRATATVLVDTSRTDPLGSTLAQGNPSVAYLATQAEILQSERVAERVIQDQGLASHAGWRQRWRDSGSALALKDWIREQLLASLEVKPARESNVIRVSLVSKQATEAAQLSNGFVQAFLATSADMRAEPARRYATFFHARAGELRAQLEQAQTKLGEYQRESGIHSSDERLDLESARLAELSSQLTQLQAMAADSRSRAAQAQGASAAKLPEVLNHPLLQELAAEANRASARLDELQTRLGERHPQVIEARAQVDAMESRLEGETRRVASGTRVSYSIQSQRLAHAQRQLELQREKVARIRAARESASVMQRDVDNARRAYDQVLARWSQAELESQGAPGPVHLLSAATVPSQAASPRVGRHLALATVAGFLLALVAAFWLNSLPSRQRGGRS